MITLTVALSSIIAYLFFGWVAALRNLPRAWTEARAFWRYSDSETVRNSVKARTVIMFLFWLFYIPGRAANASFGHVIDTGDPEAAARKVRDQERRIAELERTLDIR